MADIEKLLASIGEFVYVEMGDVKELNYGKSETSFTFTMNNGKTYTLEIKQK